jgi:hypothetical protein
MLGRRLVFGRIVEPGSPDEKISAVAKRLQRLTDRAGEADCGVSCDDDKARVLPGGGEEPLGRVADVDEP